MTARDEPPIVRSYTSADGADVTGLLDGVVGVGFADVSVADRRLSFVAEHRGHVVGVILTSFAHYEELRASYVEETGRDALAFEPAPATVAHVRELAVIEEFRRAGVASELLRRSEHAAHSLGIDVFVVNAWLPSTQEVGAGVPFYLRNGYSAVAEIPDFFASMSQRGGFRCPYCGPPPCRCGVTVFAKDGR